MVHLADITIKTERNPGKYPQEYPLKTRVTWDFYIPRRTIYAKSLVHVNVNPFWATGAMKIQLLVRDALA